MLQEILLSLSGHRSPLWDQVNEDSGSESLRSHLAPSERALLAPLAHLSDLHVKTREHTAEISRSHASMICRAIASNIIAESLSKFRTKILEVEKSILIGDAKYVGAYGIVPLSTVVGEFAPWTRRMEWLWQVAVYMLPTTEHGERRKADCTGAEAINYLENETYTGYSDLEEMANGLLEVAQRAWMRQVATWALYGKLPSHNGEDFCIGAAGSTTAADGNIYVLRHSLVPKFVSPSAARSLLSIGESLIQIRTQTTVPSRVVTDPVLALLPASLAIFNKLEYPLSSASFASTVDSIRLSISQNALSQLLPLPQVLEILGVIQDFQLLGRGEFATALIGHADARIAKRSQEVVRPVRKAGRLDDLSIKEAEASAVLSQTFTDLAALQKDDEDEDDILEKARKVLRLTMSGDSQNMPEGISTLLPTPTRLDLSLPRESALNLFLAAPELKTYASINAYLISLRRSELHLTSLWRITSLRRCYPTPLGPPSSAKPSGQKLLATQRAREVKRTAQMRRHWALVSKSLYVLNELAAYFQGEVVHGDWEHFRSWIEQEGNKRPGSASSKSTSRPGTASSARPSSLKAGQLSASVASGRHDPVALAQGHRVYLRNLADSLLLGRMEFVEALRSVLTTVDHFIALFTRLQGAWQGLDLQEDDGVVDVLSDFAKEEREVLEEMGRSGKLLDAGLRTLVEKIGAVVHDREHANVTSFEDGIDALGLASTYVPRRVRTIDRLVMKLEMLQGTKVTDEDDKLYDDE